MSQELLFDEVQKNLLQLLEDIRKPVFLLIECRIQKGEEVRDTKEIIFLLVNTATKALELTQFSTLRLNDIKLLRDNVTTAVNRAVYRGDRSEQQRLLCYQISRLKALFDYEISVLMTLASS